MNITDTDGDGFPSPRYPHFLSVSENTDNDILDRK